MGADLMVEILEHPLNEVDWTRVDVELEQMTEHKASVALAEGGVVHEGDCLDLVTRAIGAVKGALGVNGFCARRDIVHYTLEMSWAIVSADMSYGDEPEGVLLLRAFRATVADLAGFYV